MAELEQTVEDLFEGVRTDLDDPTDYELSPTLLWQKLLDSIAYYSRKIGVKSNSLLLSKAPLSITQGIQDYTLANVKNFSRALFVDVIPNAGDTRGRVTIPVVNATVQSLSDAPFGTYGGFIFWKDSAGILYARIQPTPTSNYQAFLWYKPTRLSVALFEDRPTVLEQFYVNVRKRAALSCVPHIKRDGSWKKDVGSGLDAELHSFDLLFEEELVVGEETAGIKRPVSRLFFNNDDGY